MIYVNPALIHNSSALRGWSHYATTNPDGIERRWYRRAQA